MSRFDEDLLEDYHVGVMTAKWLLLQDVSMGVFLMVLDLMVSRRYNFFENPNILVCVLLSQLVGLFLEIAQHSLVPNDALLPVVEGILPSSLVALVPLTIGAEDLLDVTGQVDAKWVEDFLGNLLG